MRRLDYHVTVQNNGVVLAELNNGERIIPSGQGHLHLDKLETITKDYLPILDTGPKQTRDRLERLGMLLYELLFVPPISGHFEELAWRKIAEQPDDYRLALSLTLQEGLRADVAALPWEFLYCARGHTFLATDQRVSFSRRYSDWASLSIKRPSEDERLRILLVRLQPRDMARVALTPISNALSDLADMHTNVLKPYVLENPDPLEVEKVLQSYRPHIVHLLIHGRFQDRGTHFALVDSSGQDVRWYGDRSLADLFTTWRPNLVLLQACEGGRTSDLLSFANGGAWLVRHHIPAVIAMHYPITNNVGWTFAQTLYTHLVAGDDLDVSVQQARRTLAKIDTASQTQDDHANRDFAAPILWMRPEVRQLFHHQKDISMNWITSPISLTITTPYGDKYQTNVPADTLVDQVVRAFLGQWQPPLAASQSSRRYSLRSTDRANQTLDRSSTLREAGLVAKANLALIPESLGPDAPIGLMIEDDQGEVYNTVVLVNTPVRHLAEAFLRDKPGTGEIIVEWVSGPSTTDTKRLKLDASLYDHGVSDDALLRIYRLPTNSEE